MIEEITCRAFYSPTAKRRYFTKAGAIHAEAIAIIKKKYPTEKLELDTGHGFHWSMLEDNEKRVRRMKRIVKNAGVKKESEGDK